MEFNSTSLNILVLGSEGFIGKHLVSFLSSAGFAVHGCDLSEHYAPGYRYFKLSVLSADYETFFSKGSYDLVINASGSGNVGHSMTYPQSDFDSNVQTVIKVLDAIRLHNPGCRYLHISSAAVYGGPAKLPVSESAPLSPLSPYGFHKLISEQLCTEYASVFGLRIAIVRPFSIFGNGLRKQLFWDICNKWEQTEKIKLFGTGQETRDFIHIDDFVRAIGLIIDKSPFKLNIYNIASGISTSIRQVAEICAGILGKTTPVFTGEIKKGDPQHWQADIHELTQLGFTPNVTLPEGIQLYINWFRQQHNNLNAR